MKYLIILATLGIGLIIILFSIVLGDKNSHTEVPNQEKEPANGLPEGKETGDPLHEHFGPSTEEKDPFEQGDKETATIQTIEFMAPKSMQYTKPDDTISTLTGAQEGYLLFNSFGNVGQVYHLGYGEVGSMGMDITHASACTNNEFVGYSSSFETTKHKIFSYDINNGFKSELYSAAPNEQIVGVECDNTRIYFTIQDGNGNMRTQIVALPAYVNDLKPSDTYLVVKDASPFLVRNEEDVFVYVQTKNILKAMNDNGIDHDIPAVFSDKVTKIISFDLNNANRWISVYADTENNLKLSLDGKVTGDFEAVLKAEWYDDKHIVVLDFDILYLYNAETNTKEVISKNNVNFVLHNGSIYLEDANGKLTVMHSKEKVEE